MQKCFDAKGGAMGRLMGWEAYAYHNGSLREAPPDRLAWYVCCFSRGCLRPRDTAHCSPDGHKREGE